MYHEPEIMERIRCAFPVGARVKVIASDLPEYIGAIGTVVDYDPGCEGDYPLVGVRFDTPVLQRERDGFYDDEIVII